jgi:hypothetical protein
MASHAKGSSSWPAAAISGTWHLLDQAADETDIPAHRMDLRFDHGPGPLRAAVLSRITGEEMPMIHGASFDGEVLRLQMVARPSENQAEMPVLVMKVAGTKLLGHWQQWGVAMGRGLKLVRGSEY